MRSGALAIFALLILVPGAVALTADVPIRRVMTGDAKWQDEDPCRLKGPLGVCLARDDGHFAVFRDAASLQAYLGAFPLLRQTPAPVDFATEMVVAADRPEPDTCWQRIGGASTLGDDVLRIRIERGAASLSSGGFCGATAGHSVLLAAVPRTDARVVFENEQGIPLYDAIPW